MGSLWIEGWHSTVSLNLGHEIILEKQIQLWGKESALMNQKTSLGKYTCRGCTRRVSKVLTCASIQNELHHLWCSL